MLDKQVVCIGFIFTDHGQYMQDIGVIIGSDGDSGNRGARDIALLTADVTAMKTMMRTAIPPPLPINAIAAKGMAMPVVISVSDIRLGYVGKLGRCSVAAAARPKVDARTNGIVNQHRPPSM